MFFHRNIAWWVHEIFFCFIAKIYLGIYDISQMTDGCWGVKSYFSMLKGNKFEKNSFIDENFYRFDFTIFGNICKWRIAQPLLRIKATVAQWTSANIPHWQKFCIILMQWSVRSHKNFQAGWNLRWIISAIYFKSAGNSASLTVGCTFLFPLNWKIHGIKNESQYIS